MSELLFVLGLLLTTASQLRLGSSPLGPGEVCLVSWLGIMMWRCLLLRQPAIGPAAAKLLTFWGLFAIALSIGTMNAFLTGEEYDPVWFLHDAMAFPLLAAVSCMSVIEPGAPARLERAAWMFAILGAVSMMVLIAGGFGWLTLPLINLWYWDRFRGWSQNPNQLSLLCIVATLVCLHLADIASRTRDRTIALLCMIPPIWAGRLTKTDAFGYALLLALLAFGGMKLHEWTRTRGPRTTVAMLTVLAVPLLIASVIPAALWAGSDGGTIVALLSKDGGAQAKEEADLRLMLWREAIERGFESGLLGLGPGPHLPIPIEIAAARVEGSDHPGDIVEPQQNASNNFEAHSTGPRHLHPGRRDRRDRLRLADAEHGDRRRARPNGGTDGADPRHQPVRRNGFHPACASGLVRPRALPSSAGVPGGLAGAPDLWLTM